MVLDAEPVEWTYGYEWSEKKEAQNFDVETRWGNVHLEDQKGDMMKVLRQVVEKCVLRQGRYWNSLRTCQIVGLELPGFAGE